MWKFIGQRRREMTPLMGDKDFFMALVWTHEAREFQCDWPAPQEIQHVQKHRRTKIDSLKTQKGV